MRYIIGFFWMIILLLTVIFVALNSHPIEINYYIGKGIIYLPFLLFLTLLIGAFIGMVAMWPLYFRTKREYRKLKKVVNSAH